MTFAQSEKVLFEEDFFDNQNLWLVGNRTKTNAFIRNGMFYLESKRTRFNYSRRIEQGFLRENQDFEIEIRMRQVKGNLLKGYALEWGGNSINNIFYEFWLRNDGHFSIDKFDGTTQQFTDYVSWQYSSEILINDFNVLKVKKEDQKLSFWLNNQLVHQMLIVPFYGNEIGFITPPAGAIEVDYLKITLLNEPPQPVIDKAIIPNIWVVIAAIANYEARGVSDLRFTLNDAVALSNFYKSPNGGGVSQQNMTVLLEEKATKANILNTLKATFGKSQENDMVVFYFSGHGIAPEDFKNNLYLLPQDYQEGDINSTIFYKEIETIFEQSKANKKLWIMDACHSGGALPKLEGNIKDVMKALQDKEIAVLTSSNLGETSLELGEAYQRGIFSYFLTSGLVSEAGKIDEDENGFITILELFEYVKFNTKETAMKKRSHKQTPQIGGKFNVQLPLSEVK